MSTLKNLVGSRYGQFEILRQPERGRRGRWYCLCRCACGTEKTAELGGLRVGRPSSCGCARRKHGGPKAYKTPEYRIWQSMLQRVKSLIPKVRRRYLDRGIKVCQRWQSFANFMADMGPRPSPQHSIDRINNDGDYEPGNCRWATLLEQQRNRSSNRLIEMNGEALPVTVWAERSGVPMQTAHARLRRGWQPTLALTAPVSAVNCSRNAGAKNRNAKLTEHDVRSIRSRYANGDSAAELSVAFGVTRASVVAIVSRRTWKSVA